MRRPLTSSVALATLIATLPAQEHWSFVAPVRPGVPDVAADNAIDAFVRARLVAEGMQPSGEANRRTLIRRLSLDLNGLPPTPEEVEAFIADTRPDAYQRLVDELLSRPQFGERMALRWLDLARYADTNGYSIDGGRHMWAWRDWVIAAYNENMPFDQFTIEQLAGDLLPDATTSQRIASGFNRNHMNTHEGGTIAEEYRVAYVVDRVKTTATTWMGLTMGCAQCHDHKYDPFSQRDYYRFFAYFNTITDKGNDGDGGKNSVPFLAVYSSEQQQQSARLRDELQRRRSELLAPNAKLDRAQQQWQRQQAKFEQVAPTLGPWHMAGPFRAANADEAFAKDFGPEAKIDLTAKIWQPRPDLTDGVAHALSGGNSAWYFHRTITATHATTAVLSFGSDDAIRVWCNNRLVVDNNTRRGVAADQERAAVALRAGENSLLIKIVNGGGPGGMYFRMLESGLPKAVLSALGRDTSEQSERERKLLLEYFRSSAPELAELREEIAAIEAQLQAIDDAPVTTAMVMEEMAKPRDTFMLARGHYAARGDKVTPGTPKVLPPMQPGAPPNRLGLARWLVDPSHPLTARVAVNHLWQTLFGRGLVATSGDFGTQGELPSHPELLDYLAVEFVESGWNVKAMLKRIVTSATYKQSSLLDETALERDPDNRLLARGARFRLAAELIRDQALAVSGLLQPTLGGPSVRPYQPDGLWREMSHYGSTPATEQVYVQDTGDKLYRRSLYTIWKRTVPPPTMVAFDAPNRELCTPRRGRTNTPLQALVLLNETGFVEAARAMGARMMTDGGTSVSDRIDYGFTLALSRKPADAEREVLLGTFAREHARFTADAAAAAALLTVGDAPNPDHADTAELAAWTMVASVLLNLGETVTRN